MRKYLLFGLLSLLTIACQKEAGTGGTATIKGKIFMQELNALGNVSAEYYAPEEDVYIIYGDDDFYGERVRTHFDGSYKFEFLHPGDYQIYTYSECDCPAGVEAIFVDVTIASGGEDILLDDIVILNL